MPIWQHSSEGLDYVRLSSEQTFVNAVIYPIPQQPSVNTDLLEMLVKRSKTPFITDVRFDPIALLPLLVS